MITAAALTFLRLLPPLPERQADVTLRLDKASVTCDYATKVTIYSCRI